MTLQDRAEQIAERANECCYRSDGYYEAIRDLVLLSLNEAIAQERAEWQQSIKAWVGL